MQSKIIYLPEIVYFSIFNFSFCDQVINGMVPIFDKNHFFSPVTYLQNIITHLKLYIEIKFELFLIYINQDLNFLCFKVVSRVLVHPDRGFMRVYGGKVANKKIQKNPRI